LEKTIAAAEDALEQLPQGHQDRFSLQINLSSCLVARYHRKDGNTEVGDDDLDRGMKVIEEVISSIEKDNALRTEAEHIFANGLLRRFQRDGSMDDLNNAMEIMDRIVCCLDRRSRESPTYLHTLGNILRIRSEHYTGTKDLNVAIQYLGEAAELFPKTDDNSSSFLSDYGYSLLRRYEKTGEISDLNEAISVCESAVISGDKSKSPNQATYLNTLGNCLQRRHERTPSLEDLNRAVSMHQKAVEFVEFGGPRLPKYLNSLSLALQTRYNFDRRSPEDLNRAIEAIQKAVDLLPAKQPNRSKYQNNLANALESRGRATNSMEDLERACKVSHSVLKSTPDTHANRAMYLDCLSSRYLSLYDHTHKIDYLHNVISILQDCVGCTAKESSDFSLHQNKLGDALSKRHSLKQLASDYQCAVLAYEEAARMPSGSPILRIRGAFEAGKLQIAGGDFIHASQNLKSAVELLPLLDSRLLNRQDRQRLIIGDIASIAATTLLQTGADVAEALDLLEKGRGNLISLQLETRVDSEISALERKYPSLAQNFKDLRKEVEASQTVPSTLDNPTVDLTKHDRDRRNAATRFEEGLKSIRRLPGFERFIVGPSSDELKCLASRGPIVVFNVNSLRSDTFLITAKEIRCLPLPDFKYAKVRAAAQKIAGLSFKLEELGKSREILRDILKWMWDGAVKTILEELNVTKPPADGSDWPRVWWVTAGVLSLLPIHAAGDHQTWGESVLDRVISSYALTLKSLVYSREQAAKPQPAKQQTALLVAMSNAPDLSSLPYVAAEMEAIQTILPKSVTKTVLDRPTDTDVLKQLPSCQIAHFACHGISNSSDPSESCLILHESKLAVKDMVSLKLDHAQLAYISACDAAVNRTDKLLDDGIHLAGIMQLAGFPHVVGTLWPINDWKSVAVAECVYEELFKDGCSFDVSRTAHGLHKATRQLRESSGRRRGNNSAPPNPDPLLWAPYIHLGA
jgi:tetratricopeptide (TPR) repeat protein